MEWRVYSPHTQNTGKNREQVKKITVSIPLNVLKVRTDERTRRQINNLRHQRTANYYVKHFCMRLLGNRYLTMMIYVKITPKKCLKK